MATVTRILVVFHSGEGHTEHVAQRIAGFLRERDVYVDVREAVHAPAPDGYDGVVLGDSIHVGHHSKALIDYAREHARGLGAMPSAFFQVSMTSAARDPEHARQAHAYVDDFVEETGWHPGLVGLFAGALLYTRYGWVTSHVMKSIARHEGRSTDTSVDHDYTDWDAVDAFASDVLASVAGHRAGATQQLRA